MNKKISSAIKDIKFINERLGLLIIQDWWYKIAIVNVHAPTENKDDEIKEGSTKSLRIL